ncbi:histone-like nucleoid-structuring protein Lsr2, partial [Streptomyces klenkii]|uniref:Lsr2 family DNA-binding protein n=1 Tax=Streptomyces klenkii TaxID=1420899 RepID=UPI0033BEBDE9
MTAGKKLGRGRKSAPRSAVPRPSEDTAAIRAWAKKNGFPVNERGRVPAEIRKAYAKR